MTQGDRLVISFEMPGGQLIGYADLFDAAGKRLGTIDNDIDEDGLIQRTELVVPSDGTYFLIVYDDADDSGYAAGPYRLRLERILPATSTLTGIESAARPGRPRSDMPSANVGQRITITGEGLTVADPVFFSGIDHTGESLVGIRVIPVSASPDGRSLDVVVPEGARTGKIWLSGEDTGIVIQIVPVISGLTVFQGPLGGIGLRGTGLEDPVVVHFGDFDMVDYSRLEGIGSTFGIPLLPDGIPLGPISLSSAGGTSAPFDGFAVDAVVAVAAVGTAPGPGPSLRQPAPDDHHPGPGLHLADPRRVHRARLGRSRPPFDRVAVHRERRRDEPDRRGPLRCRDRPDRDPRRPERVQRGAPDCSSFLAAGALHELSSCHFSGISWRMQDS